MPMNRIHRSLSIAFVLSGIAGASPAAQGPPPAAAKAPPAAASSPDSLAAVLAPHREAWRPCHVLVEQLKENARAVDQALVAGRDKDAERLGKQTDKVMKTLDKKCGPVKSRLVETLQQTGASQAEMDAAWSTFNASFEEPAAGVAEKK
jgi:hypothetical protein